MMGRSPAERDALVLAHLHLVPAVARARRLDRCRVPAAPVDRDDYLAAGAEALVRAAETWQPDGGAAFATYAWRRIGWAMWYEERRMRWQGQAGRRADRRLVSLHATHDHYPDDPDATIADTLPDPGPDLAVLVEVRALLEAAVGQLRPSLREVVRLCCLEDLPQQDVAELLGITQPAVAERLRNARRALAVSLRGLLAEAVEAVAPGRESLWAGVEVA